MKYFSNLAKTLALAIFVLSPLAKADIRGGHSKVYVEVKVTPHENNHDLDTVQFRSCNKDTGKCRLLGYKRDYTITELHDQRYQEQWEAAFSTIGTVVIGWAAITVAAPYVFEEIISSALGYSISGGAMGLSLITPYGPVEQFRQQYVLRDAVIRDTDVFLVDYNTAEMKVVADRLDLVLEKVLTAEQKKVLKEFFN